MWGNEFRSDVLVTEKLCDLIIEILEILYLTGSSNEVGLIDAPKQTGMTTARDKGIETDNECFCG